MSENNHNSGCSTGCLITGIGICIMALIALLTAKDSPMILIILFLITGIHCGLELRKAIKREKAVDSAYTDARALMLEINKDLLQWKDAQRLSFSENLPGKVVILQTSQSTKKIAILRYDSVTLTADLRVYAFSELRSWKTKVEQKNTRIPFFEPLTISRLSVELTFLHKKKIIEHKIVLFASEATNEHDAPYQHKRLKLIQDFLTYIQPESR